MRSMLTAVDHREARRLLWKSRHVPILTIFASSWVVAGVLSAVLSILAQGPGTPSPERLGASPAGQRPNGAARQRPTKPRDGQG